MNNKFVEGGYFKQDKEKALKEALIEMIEESTIMPKQLTSKTDHIHGFQWTEIEVGCRGKKDYFKVIFRGTEFNKKLKEKGFWPK